MPTNPIKLRAWSRIENKMFPHGSFTYRDRIVMPVATQFNGSYTENVGAYEDRFVLSQSTGLTDANGVEIWEGDTCEADGIKGTVEPLNAAKTEWGLVENDGKRHGLSGSVKVTGHRWE
jgi:uncharacterized phage protein (TIGR01671 family)